MSQLVENDFQTYFHQQYNQYDIRQSDNRNVYDGLLSKINKSSGQGINSKIITSNKNSTKIRTIVFLKLQESTFDLLLQINIDIKNKTMQFIGSFLKEDQYLLTQMSQRRKIICRKFLKMNNQISNFGLRFIQNLQNGKLLLCFTSQISSSLFLSSALLWHFIKCLLQTYYLISCKYSLEILQITNKQSYKHIVSKKRNDLFMKVRKEELEYGKLIKQVEFSHIHFGFSFKADQSSFPNFEKSKKQEDLIKHLFNNIKTENVRLFCKQLYATDFLALFDISSNQITCQMEQSQSNLYYSYLKTPSPKDPNVGQNKYIFNQINIQNAQQVKFKQTSHQGGQNIIKTCRLSYSYCQYEQIVEKSPNQSQLLIHKKKLLQKVFRPLLTKHLAIKIPKYKHKDQKHQNQKNIIRLFQNGVSAYILKYYVSKQKEFQYRDCVLMDYLHGTQPISNFVEIWRQTLSINSKVFIMVNLANSLRIIKDYQIVHMDLNLNNVLVYRDYLTKIIDFGQAYSRNVPSSYGPTFKRAITFPFCSPQHFSRKQQYTIQQDVFALGMILHRLIFDDYPFFAAKKLIKTYQNGSYLKRIYLAPQRGQAYDNIQTINMLYNLIFKCIAPNEHERCQPSWLTIFFKIIYFHLV